MHHTGVRRAHHRSPSTHVSSPPTSAQAAVSALGMRCPTHSRSLLSSSSLALICTPAQEGEGSVIYPEKRALRPGLSVGGDRRPCNRRGQSRPQRTSR